MGRWVGGWAWVCTQVLGIFNFIKGPNAKIQVREFSFGLASHMDSVAAGVWPSTALVKVQGCRSRHANYPYDVPTVYQWMLAGVVAVAGVLACFCYAVRPRWVVACPLAPCRARPFRFLDRYGRYANG